MVIAVPALVTQVQLLISHCDNGIPNVVALPHSYLASRDEIGTPGKQGATHSKPEHRHSELGILPADHRSGPRFQLGEKDVATDSGYGEMNY